MKHHHLYFLLIPLISLQAAQSDWVLLDNMEDDTFPAWTLTDNTDGNSFLAQFQDTNGQTGSVLCIDYRRSSGLMFFAHASAVLPLQHPIEEGQTGTLYLRFNAYEFLNQYVIGFSDVPITPDGSGGFTSLRDWSEFEGGFLLDDTYGGLIKVRSGGSYKPTSVDGSTQTTLERDTWYHVWFVIDNEVGATNDQYAVYLQGGIYSTPTHLKVADDPDNPTQYLDKALFRNQTTDSIKNIYIRKMVDYVGSALGDYLFFDNMAQAPGVELSIPSPVTIDCFECQDEQGVSYTHWLGWFNRKKSPWIYAYSLDSWLWISDEAVTTSGTWIYIRK